MFHLIFGLVWLGFIAFFTIMFMSAMIASSAPFPILIFVVLFLSMFWYVGIVMVKSGIKQYKANKNTDLYGEECYGKITAVYETGSYVNDNPEYKADIVVYIPSINDVVTVSEVIGYSKKEYPLGTPVRGKYYNGDINIIERGPIVTMSPFAEEKINEYMKHYGLTPQDTVVIDGVEYVRKDTLK